MNRRDFLQSAGVLSAISALQNRGRLFAQRAKTVTWRTFEVTTRVEVLKPSGPTLIWVPSALTIGTPYQQTLATTFQCEGGSARTFESKADALGIIAAQFPTGIRPMLAVTSRVATRNWEVNLSAPGKTQRTRRVELDHWLQPTKLLPTDGIVKDTAMAITRNARTDFDMAHAIYEWILENTYRKPNTRGCGIGNVRFMLQSGDPRRQMCRSERAFRCACASRRTPSAGCVWHPRSQIGDGIPEPGRLVR
jgi:hypothetical protein